MNREIKFRAWNPDDNKMEYPIVMATCNDGVMKPLILCADGNKTYKDYPLMQYTGLKDKEGKEIYEGDIVKCHYFHEALGESLGVYEAEREIVAEISFEEMGLWLQGDSEDNSGYLLFYPIDDDSIEVIGNIHENPELLSETK